MQYIGAVKYNHQLVSILYPADDDKRHNLYLHSWYKLHSNGPKGLKPMQQLSRPAMDKPNDRYVDHTSSMIMQYLLQILCNAMQALTFVYQPVLLL